MLADTSALPPPFPSVDVDHRDSSGVESNPETPIVITSGTGKVKAALSHDGGQPEVDTSCNIHIVGLTTDSP